MIVISWGWVYLFFSSFFFFDSQIPLHSLWPLYKLNTNKKYTIKFSVNIAII